METNDTFTNAWGIKSKKGMSNTSQNQMETWNHSDQENDANA